MSIVRTIRHRDCAEVPWKNGGGTTRGIAAFPPGATIDDFLWRISMARVAADGPFSRFDGIDRVLTVIEGVLELRSADGVTILDSASPPFGFNGEAAIAGRPRGGAAIDLNVMVRRGSYQAKVVRMGAGDIAVPRGTSFLCALAPQRIADATLALWDCAEIAADVTATAEALHIDMTIDR
ncbi:hypothetical protein ASE00_21495 [Sphingomonas sp. Root710]|uniref:HutD/Ves family protein n=1 Tax=Sphingomonas sp. Root710 TaxID=1736594 RepID=UPI000700EA92|nr:HutD family protein [Sphingomonas sp. Root710]KRB85058.1 hypothetical protein ASE00_21495 [Sphingomonas sp. Root710]